MASRTLRMVLPTGRMQDAITTLLDEAGITLRCRPSDYRPTISDDRFEVKLLRAANIPRLVEFGAHDIGFSGRDWVSETRADVDTVLDTGLLPVRIVAAAPEDSRPFERSDGRPLVVASEYETLTCAYMDSKQVDYRYLRTYGATEVFPPEDADIIVDNVATGRTLASNGLAVIDELMTSSCVMIANRAALADPALNDVIQELRMLIQSVLDARARVLLDMNVTADRLQAVVELLPAMKSPTIQPLYGDRDFAVRAAVPRERVKALIPQLRRAGATDLLQTAVQRVMA